MNAVEQVKAIKGMTKDQLIKFAVKMDWHVAEILYQGLTLKEVTDEIIKQRQSK